MSKQHENSCKVWSRYQVTKKDGSIIKLRFQELEFEKNKDIIDFFTNFLLKEEVLYKAAGISNNEEAVTEYTDLINLLYDYIPPNISVCYIDDGSETIVGISITSDKKTVTEDYDLSDFKPSTKEVQNLFNIINVTKDMKVTNGFESFYEGKGIYVQPDHRGLGIANEFVRLRKQICIDNDVEMTWAWMTALGTQKAADKYNWKTFIELPVEEMARQTGLTFDADVPTFKLMYTTKD